MSIKKDNKLVTFGLLIAAIFSLSLLLYSQPIVTKALPPIETNDTKQIIIGPLDLKNYSSVSTTKVNYEGYEKFYNPSFLFDNLINSYSKLSVRGIGASFNVDFSLPLNASLCSVQFDVFNPTLKTPIDFTVTNGSGSLTASDVLDSSPKTIKLQQCVNNVSSISAKFYPADSDEYTILNELKLYSNNNVVNPPPLECPDGYHIEGDKCVIDPIGPPPGPNPGGNQTITNSTITIKISNSTVYVEAEDSNLIFPNITIPANPDNPIACPPDSFWNGTQCVIATLPPPDNGTVVIPPPPEPQQGNNTQQAAESNITQSNPSTMAATSDDDDDNDDDNNNDNDNDDNEDEDEEKEKAEQETNSTNDDNDDNDDEEDDH